MPVYKIVVILVAEQLKGNILKIVNVNTIKIFNALILVFAACNKASKPLEKPSIALKSISKVLVKELDNKDTVIINLRYTMAVDGVGSGTEAPIVYLKDTRFDDNQTPYPFPDDVINKLPDYEPNISGAITLKLPVDVFFALRPDRQEGDTMQYEIHMEDKNGIKSNTVNTPDIFIVP